MIIVATKDYKGELRDYLIEIKTNVFIGILSKKNKDTLLKTLNNECDSYIVAWEENKEIRFEQKGNNNKTIYQLCNIYCSGKWNKIIETNK